MYVWCRRELSKTVDRKSLLCGLRVVVKTAQKLKAKHINAILLSYLTGNTGKLIRATQEYAGLRALSTDPTRDCARCEPEEIVYSQVLPSITASSSRRIITIIAIIVAIITIAVIIAVPTTGVVATNLCGITLRDRRQPATTVTVP